MSLRVLIIGHGSIGKRHLRIVRESLPDAEIRVLRHRSVQDIPDLANSVCSSLDEAIAFAPLMAVIANPAPFHVQSASALASIGCHLLIEKPLAADSTGLELIKFLEQVKVSGIVCQVGYNLRYLPSLIEFRRLLQAGDIGRLLSVRSEVGQYLPDWRLNTDYRLGVSARSDLGGGVLLELSHEIDYLRWIFGDIAWVQASLSQQSDLEIDVEDTAHLILGFQANADGHRLIANLSMDFVRHDATRCCIAIGEQGSLRWNGLTGVIDTFKAGSKAWTEMLNGPHGCDDSYYLQWQHFMRCVQTGERPLVDGESGLAVLKIVEAAKASAAQQGLRSMTAPNGYGNGS